MAVLQACLQYAVGINMEFGKILVVDDDREIVRAIAKLLELEGYQVLRAYDGMEALDLVMSNEIHLILLDVMMPRLNGLSAMMKIRESKNIPIIILSAKTEESDKVLGLSMGADDYVSKPFNTAELIARVKSQLRRYLALGTIGTGEQTNDNIIALGDLVLDKNGKEIQVNGRNAKLTATEYKILELLMSNPGRVFSAEEIYSRVWNEEAYSVENTVMVHIRRIREKIEINPKTPQYLKVVWGIGYKIEKLQH
nr:MULTISPECIES: response regulator transcription factor [Robinsoniella]